MKFIGSLAVVLVIGFARSAAIEPPQEPSVFRAGVDLVSLSVTVTDGRQHYVSDLSRGDFLVTENGIPQTLTFFAKTGIPLSLALLIDTSASMEQTLATAQEAAVGFVRHLTPRDRAMIVDFDSRVQTLQPFTEEQAALELAIRQTTAGGSTALYNALYIALKELVKVKTQDDNGFPRRRAIVVLSDGEDTSSLVTFEDVLELASRSDTAIYAIGLGARQQSGTRFENDAQYVLRQLATRTGGRAFFPNSINDLTDVYSDIREELATQYSIAYESSSPRRDGQWRQVVVRVNRSSVAVRTKQGYFAPVK